ncbi:MAG: GTPase HflX [Candidatus Aureabacteria bacterium]|nr:GTPase HflX [Candidatus Auribacterota bacterium]
MKIIHVNDAQRERAVLVGVETPRVRGWQVEDHLAELAELARTAGAEVVETLTQKLSRLNPAYYIGKGKADELKAVCLRESARLVIFDDELGPAQVKNLQDLTGSRVIDRTELIMDIFARRAKSREGKIQVELAQLQYMLPRLTRAWTHLSRQEGGIGTRGPGEQQLEIDRRRIREKIDRLSEQLEGIERERHTQARRRQRGDVPVVALVGYTNAGKSTLMNTLTAAGVFVEDRLFATLDPTTRHLRLPGGRRALLTDTVGFIRKLPHHLVESFKATLEGVATADLLLHVIDSAHEHCEEQIEAVCGVLKEIGAGEKPVIAAFNKIDLPRTGACLGRYARAFPSSVRISALKGDGIGELLQMLERELGRGLIRVQCTLPAAASSLVARVYREGNVLSCAYEDDCVMIDAELPPALAGEMKQYYMKGKR